MSRTSIVTDKDTVKKLKALSPDGNVSKFIRDIANDPKLAAQRMTAESAVLKFLQKQIEELKKELDHIHDEVHDNRIYIDAIDTASPEKHGKVHYYYHKEKGELRVELQREAAFEREFPHEYARYQVLLKEWMQHGEELAESGEIDLAGDFMPDFQGWIEMGQPDLEGIRKHYKDKAPWEL